MITYEEAKTFALARLAKDSPTLDLVIQDEQTIVKPYGWILFYCTRQYAETGDFLYMLGGGGPLVVRHNGRTDQLEGRMAAEPTIAEWERKNGLKG